MAYIKANEKLPRGSYFYVKVGDRFYASTAPELKEVEVPWTWGVQKSNQFPTGRSNRGWKNEEGTTRTRRDMRKGSLAKYRTRPKRPETKVNLQPTGRFNPILVDSVKEAKHFRRKDQAENACEKLKSLYGSLGISVKIEFEKGESQ